MTPLPAVADLVPHAPPMLAVEELVDWSPGRARARLTVREDSPFARDGAVDAVITLEYMAQTVAACLGYEAFRSGEGVRVGMVIACRKMTVARPAVAVGDELHVEVECVRGSGHVSHFDGAVRDAAGDLVAQATLTLVHGEKPPD